MNPLQIMNMPWPNRAKYNKAIIIFDGMYCIYYMMTSSNGNIFREGQWSGPLMLSLIYAWINSRVNNRDAGYLRRRRAHYDVTVMILTCNVTEGWTTGVCSPPCKKRFDLKTQLYILITYQSSSSKRLFRKYQIVEITKVPEVIMNTKRYGTYFLNIG